MLLHRRNQLTGSREFDYTDDGGEMELGLFGDAMRSLEAGSSNQSDTSLSIGLHVNANKSDEVISKDIPNMTFVNSPSSNAVAVYKVGRYHVPAANQTPTKPSSPRGTKRTREDDTNNHNTAPQSTNDAVRVASDLRRSRSRSSSLSSPPSSSVPPSPHHLKEGGNRKRS